MTDTPTTEKAQAAASTAADEGKHVAGVAQGEAAKVASEAKDQAKSLAGEARTQVTEQVSDQSRQQRDKLVSTLGTLGDDLDQMAQNSSGGLASDVAREVAQHARSLTSYLDGREPTELLEDVRDFARRRPGVFLAGALVAGVVAGRVARGVKDAPSGPGSSSQPSQPTTSGFAGTGTPTYGETYGDTPSYSTPGLATPVTPGTSAGRNVGTAEGDPLSGFPSSPPPSSPPGTPTYDPTPTQAFDPLAPETPPAQPGGPYSGAGS
ncbi:MAG: hypothetical protein JWN84_3932 [Nocardioides sp.]|nr:hypothetical protein [Nocardioides sp.]